MMCLIRAFHIFALSILSVLPLWSQAYQTRFSPVDFERTKAPAIWHGGAEVETATGAVLVDIPIGPGIGDRGVRWQPALRGRISPQVPMRPSHFEKQPWADRGLETYNWVPENIVNPGAPFGPTFSLSPGFIKRGINGGMHIQLPDGQNVSDAYQSSTPNEALAIVRKFQGYESGWSVSRGGNEASIGVGGELVVGLEGPMSPALTVPRCSDEWLLQYPVNGSWFSVGLSTRILVIRGEVAYEFTHAGLLLEPTIVTTYPNEPPSSLYAASNQYFRLTKILNRGGDAITFTYQDDPTPVKPGTPSPTFPPITAKWYVDGTFTGVQVNLTKTNLTYSASGSGSWPNYTLAASSPADQRLKSDPQSDFSAPKVIYGHLDCWDDCRTDVTSDADEKVSFDCTGVSDLFPNSPRQAFRLGQLSSITFPGRRIEFTWGTYHYRPQEYSDLGTFGYGAWSAPIHPWKALDQTHVVDMLAAGVTQVAEVDLATQTSRVTTYNRTVPVPDLLPDGLGEDFTYHWTATLFQTLVSHPDGTSTLYRFAEPPQDVNGKPPMDVPAIIQTKAHLKHQPIEIRRYPAGADTNDEGMSAFRREFFDRFDVLQTGNAKGASPTSYIDAFQGSAYPTRVRTFDRFPSNLTTKEMLDWDNSNFAWKSSIQCVQKWDGSSPTTEWLSFRLQNFYGIPGSDPRDGTYASKRTVQTTYQSWPADWIFARPLGKSTTNSDALSDTEGSPLNSPAESWTYSDTDVPYRPTDHGGGQIDLAFHYVGTTGVARDQVLNLSLKSMAGSYKLDEGKVGIKTYGYDNTTGRMNSILQKGAGASTSQTQDGLGRVISQTDSNDFTTIIGYDTSSRITEIRPANSESSTTISYDADCLGFTVSRGGQKSLVRFNGYGELIREARLGPNGWSYRKHGYDSGGRKLWSSTWVTGKGDDSGWNLSRQISKDIWLWTYDDQGRVIREDPPNGDSTITVFSNRAADGDCAQKTVLRYPQGLTDGNPTGASQTTIFWQDLLGRLASVTNANGEVSDYRYDALDRPARVIQWSGSRDTLPRQDRTWEYTHPMGWTTALVQPESGRTEYSDFDVLGHPWKVTYGAGSSSPKVLSSVFDELSRLTKRSATDVDEIYTYGETAHGAAVDRLTTETSGSITRSFTYGGLNGRLSGLDTLINGGSPISQTFGYNLDGARTVATVDGRKVTTTYESATGLPSSVFYDKNLQGSSSLATAAYDDDSWSLKGLVGQGWFSKFAYDADQTRLHSMSHTVPNFEKSWVYNYDGVGRLTSDTEDTYHYDVLNRLTQAIVARLNGQGTVTQNLAYDAFGNRVSSLTSGNLPSPSLPGFNINNFAFNSDEKAALAIKNQLPKNASGVPTGSDYDAQGNLTTIYGMAGNPATQITLGYDTLGRVFQVTDGKRPGFMENYFYTGEGLRTLVDEFQNNVLQKRRYNIYNDLRQLVSEYELVFE